MSVPSVVLIVLDGWGLAPDGPGNAADRILRSNPPAWLVQQHWPA